MSILPNCPNNFFPAMSALSRRFRSFQLEPQPRNVRKETGATINYRALNGGYLSARAERGRRKAEANGQSPEDMISSLLDKAAGAS